MANRTNMSAGRTFNNDLPISLDAALRRVGESIGSNKDINIAAALGVPRSSLSTWRKRQHMPYKQIVVFCIRCELPVEQILLGTLPTPNNSSDALPPQKLSAIYAAQQHLVEAQRQLKEIANA